MARRENGTGSIRPDPSRPGEWKGKRWTGSWVGTVQVDGRRYSARGASKSAVSSKLAVRKAQAITSRGRHAVDRRITVSEVVETFLELDVPERNLAPSTVDYYRWTADLIIGQIGSVRLVDLSVERVEAMLKALSTRKPNPLGKAVLHKVRGTLQRAITFAEARGKVELNVAKLAKLPPKAAPTVARRALGPDDARTLLAALRTERNGLLFGLGLRLGLRPGESAGLYWSDVDLDAGIVNVTRGVRMLKGRAEVADGLKTASSKRTIQMPDDLTEWFRDHRRDQTVERLAAPRWVDERLVFASPTGNVLSPPNTRRQLSDICERLEADRAENRPDDEPFPAVKPNELRHSCASLLSDEGVPNELIADLLGHTTTRMVDQTYRHRLRPVVDVAARARWTLSG